VRSFLEKTCHEEKDENVLEAARGILRKADIDSLTSEIENPKHNNKDFHDQLEKIVRNTCLHGIDEFTGKNPKTIPPNFARAKKLLQKLFGLSEEAWLICEFIFLSRAYYNIESFFENELYVFSHSEQHLLACMLDIPLTKLRSLLTELKTCRIIDVDTMSRCGSATLPDSIYSLWDKKTDYEKDFGQPLDIKKHVCLAR